MTTILNLTCGILGGLVNLTLGLVFSPLGLVGIAALVVSLVLSQ